MSEIHTSLLTCYHALWQALANGRRGGATETSRNIAGSPHGRLAPLAHGLVARQDQADPNRPSRREDASAVGDVAKSPNRDKTNTRSTRRFGARLSTAIRAIRLRHRLAGCEWVRWYGGRRPCNSGRGRRQLSVFANSRIGWPGGELVPSPMRQVFSPVPNPREAGHRGSAMQAQHASQAISWISGICGRPRQVVLPCEPFAPNPND
jgi:hypothetical protein